MSRGGCSRPESSCNAAIPREAERKRSSSCLCKPIKGSTAYSCSLYDTGRWAQPNPWYYLREPAWWEGG
eukprot:gene20025-biopygen850